jgi:hypothetical protein
MGSAKQNGDNAEAASAVIRLSKHNADNLTSFDMTT